jgi:hypothetical protein
LQNLLKRKRRLAANAEAPVNPLAKRAARLVTNLAKELRAKKRLNANKL